MRKNYFYFILLFFLLACNQENKNSFIVKTDNINNDTQAENFYLSSKNKLSDSIHSTNLLELVKYAHKTKNWELFHKYRLEQIKNPLFNKFLKTTAITLDYSGYYFLQDNKHDSAFYYYQNSYKVYNTLKDSAKVASILTNIAILQKNTFQFKESETTSFKALNYLKNTNKQRKIASLYNNLGIIYKGLNDFENAINYHKKSYNLRKKLQNKNVEIASLNNIGNVYKEKKEYDTAISFYKKALAFDSILKTKLKTKAMLLDNYAFALFLNQETTKLPKLFFEALKIRDSINDKPGLIVSNIHLGSYYKKLGNNRTALKYLETAKSLSSSIYYKKDELEAMELLLDLYPPKQAIATAKNILFIRDSIQKAERNIKESISRIQFETSEKENLILEQEKVILNKDLANNRKKNIILIFVIIFITILLIIFYIWFLKYKQTQKFKNGFQEYLTKKYKLTKTNLEFWEILIKGLTQNELADQLCISINGVKSRRKALFSKIKISSNSPTTFDKSKAILLYKKENDLFKNSTSK